MWGNGKQTRSFCYIDDCVEVRTPHRCPAPCLPGEKPYHCPPLVPQGILRLFTSDYKKPLNLGSDEMVSMNQMAG